MSNLAKTLRTVESSVIYVDFDVTNPEHVAAYVCLTQYGRQHPTLRFNVKTPFTDVHSMMNAMIGAEYAKQFENSNEQARQILGIKGTSRRLSVV